MKLEAIKYSRFADEPDEWRMEGKPIENEYGQWCTFGDINLMVGKNATGKTKTLEVVRDLADLLAGDDELSEMRYPTGDYQVQFSNSQHSTILYTLQFRETNVFSESLLIDGKVLLKRGENGIGELYHKAMEQEVKFQVPNDQIVAFLRRGDNVQHPFLDDLYQWGKSLNYYQFGGYLGKNQLARIINPKEDFNLKNSSMAIPAFEKGKAEFGERFLDMIKEDMKTIDYEIEEVGTGPLKAMVRRITAFGKEMPMGLSVKEHDLNGRTDQAELSQGMFRALSLIIQLNYSLLAKATSGILIDDIGEGLDYERSKRLIDLLIRKAEESSVQIFMTTKDRFVMNKIPLAYWSVITREKQRSLFYNYRNAKDVFDEFQYTGLNNFDFFASEFYRSGFQTTD